MDLLSRYEELNPRQKKLVIWLGGAGGIFFVAWLLSSIIQTKGNERIRVEKPEVTVIAPSRLTGVEGFAGDIEALRREINRMNKKIEDLVAENRELREEGSSKVNPIDATNVLDVDFSDEDVASEYELSEVGESSISGPGNQLPLPPLDINNISDESIPAMPISPEEEGEYFNAAEAYLNQIQGNNESPDTVVRDPFESEPLKEREAPVSQENQISSGMPEQKRNFRVVSEVGDLSSDQEIRFSDSLAEEDDDDDEVYIPAGSMFTGVLLNGLDAPTSAAAQKNPTPVVMRVKREAVLPNYALIDVRECFVLAAGYGQLSSERAIMRAESLSCVRTDGQVFEAKLDSYIVGTDGKVGIPGRLVSKQGQLIAQTLLAGTLGGIGEAFTSNKIPQLNINPLSNGGIYQSEDLATIAQNGLTEGFSTTTNMIAKFYLDMAKEIFPVVEIPAGEVGTIIVTRGSHLPLRGSTSLKKYKRPLFRNNREERKEEVDEASPVEVEDDVQGVKIPKLPQMPSFSNGLGW